MIKHINHQNVSTTPFVAAKARVLSNIQNSDTLILEPDVYTAGTNVSLDYVDYNSGDPIINRECDVALEQQGEVDSLGYEEGITGSGNFNSASDSRNTDGTYKSLVYTTTKNAFYNSYRNPTEIFGVEHIDFPLSKTLRNLSDSFRMFNIPQTVFGDKIQPQSLRFYDTLLDDNVTIIDDGYQNLIAGYNLFSKVQEVRTWPSGAGVQNEIFPGTASFNCPTYDSLFLTDPVDVYADLGTNISFSVSSSGTPRPITYQWYSGSTRLMDGGQISGSNGPVLFINNIWWSNTGSYRVMAHNAATMGATSSFANLHIQVHPPAITGPYDTSAEVGGTFLFCVNLTSGALPMTYSWQSGSTFMTDNTRISGSTGSCLTINDVQISDTGSYRVLVSNFYGGVTSSYANGHVNIYAPLIVSDPQDQTVYSGFSASFHVTASGTLPLMYHWISGSTYLVDSTRITGSVYTGSTTSSLFINNVLFSDTGSYKVEVSNILGSVQSNIAWLNILDNSILTSASLDTASFGLALRFGSLDISPHIEYAVTGLTINIISGSLTTVIIPVYVSSTASVDSSGFYSGSIIDTVLTVSGSSTASVDSSGFYSGSVIDVVFTVSGSGTASVDSSGFYSGSLMTIVTQSYQQETGGVFLALISGSLVYV